MSDDLFSALRREIDECQKLQAKAPERIRLNPGVPAGSMIAMPIPPANETEELARIAGRTESFEVLIHPADWDRLVHDHYLPTIESNMRSDGATADEIDVMRANAYANPHDFRLEGIPVVDDMPKVFQR